MAFPLYLIIGWIRVVGKLLDPRMLHWLNQLNKPAATGYRPGGDVGQDGDG